MEKNNSIWHSFNSNRIKPNDFYAVVEIEKGSKMKYELDKESGFLKLDRVLYTSTVYPASYGFIPKTYADDNDPLDVLILSAEPITPMSIVRCYPIGAITMVDSDSNDEKIIAIPFGDPTYNGYTDIKMLPEHMFNEMTHFFTVYKELEHKETAVREVVPKDESVEIIKKSIENYRQVFEK